MAEDISIKMGPNPGREAIRSEICNRAGDILTTLVGLMMYSEDDKVRLNAASKLLDKLVPNLSQNDIGGEGAKTLAGLVQLFSSKNNPV